MKMDFDLGEALTELSEKSGISKEELQQKINEKVQKFSGLLTEQGALVLLSKDLRVPLPFMEKKPMHIALGKLQNGMNNIDVRGKVSAMNPVRTYDKNGKQGKYLAVKMKDETGEALFTFWNEQVDEALQKQIGMDSEIAIQNARVKTFNNQLQLSLGYNATYTITAGKQEVASVAVTQPKQALHFGNAKAGDYLQVQAMIVEVLPGKGYYLQCESCKAKPRQMEDSCSACGKSGTIKMRLLLPVLLDDGQATMRAVAFEDQAVQMYGAKKDEVLDALASEEGKEKLHAQLVGKRIDVSGKTKVGMDSVSVELLVNTAKSVPF